MELLRSDYGGFLLLLHVESGGSEANTDLPVRRVPHRMVGPSLQDLSI